MLIAGFAFAYFDVDEHSNYNYLDFGWVALLCWLSGLNRMILFINKLSQIMTTKLSF